MQFSAFAVLVSLLQFVVAQTPDAFIPRAAAELVVVFGNGNVISPAGELIPRNGKASWNSFRSLHYTY